MKLDCVGRTTIPYKVRQRLGIKPGQILEVYLNYGKITLSVLKISEISKKEFVGIPRKVTFQGKIMIPRELIELTDISLDSKVNVFLDEDEEKIVIKKIE